MYTAVLYLFYSSFRWGCRIVLFIQLQTFSIKSSA